MFQLKRNDYNALSDEELMNLAAKAKAGAFEIIYTRYFKKLVWFARGFVEDEQVAKDIVQEVFVIIIEKPELFDSSKKFSTWVYVVTANLSKQHLRTQKNRQRLLNENKEETILNTTARHSYDSNLLNEKLAKVIKGLSDKDKQIYLLRFENELKIKDIAELLNMPEGTVKSGIYYLLKKLSVYLKDFIHE